MKASLQALLRSLIACLLITFGYACGNHRVATVISSSVSESVPEHSTIVQFLEIIATEMPARTVCDAQTAERLSIALNTLDWQVTDAQLDEVLTSYLGYEEAERKRLRAGELIELKKSHKSRVSYDALIVLDRCYHLLLEESSSHIRRDSVVIDNLGRAVVSYRDGKFIIHRFIAGGSLPTMGMPDLCNLSSFLLFRRLINEQALNMETPITNTYEGDGLRRCRVTMDISHNVPVPITTTLVWDGTDYLGEITT